MTSFKLYNESIDKRISMFDHNNIKYSLFILKYETNRAKFSVFFIENGSDSHRRSQGGPGGSPLPQSKCYQ